MTRLHHAMLNAGHVADTARGIVAARKQGKKGLPGCPVPSTPLAMLGREGASCAWLRALRAGPKRGQGFDGTGQPGSTERVGTKGVPRRFDAKRPCRAGVEQRAWKWKQAPSSTRQDLHGANPGPAGCRLDGTG